MKRLLRNKKGISLIELVVSIAIFVLIGGIVGVFIIQGFTLYRSELGSNEDGGNLRNALTSIVNDMRRADGSAINVENNTLTVDGDVYSFSNSSILLNGSVFATGVSAFTVTSANSVIDISIATDEGRVLSTSYGYR